MTPLLLVVDLLAVYRLTVLVTRDFVTLRLRARAAASSETFGYFVHCPWCVSFWMACVLAAASLAAPQAVFWPAFVLACSGAAGLLSEASAALRRPR